VTQAVKSRLQLGIERKAPIKTADVCNIAEIMPSSSGTTFLPATCIDKVLIARTPRVVCQFFNIRERIF